MLKRNICFIHSRGNVFIDQLDSIFYALDQRNLNNIVRMVFFGNPSCHVEYLKQLEIIGEWIELTFENKPPTFSYIWQPPLGGSSLILEVTAIVPDDATQIVYKNYKNIPYILVKQSQATMLFLTGMKAGSFLLNVRNQADAVFSGIEKILQAENFHLSSIVRQWNYIQDIVGVENGKQNYQEFNDSRSFYYGKTSFSHGFPAATGIGAVFPGVSIDLDALLPTDSSLTIIPVNNKLQVPAHFYSAEVLFGDDDECSGIKTTPKFERAKLILSGNKGILYLSGTAAIRGEMSLQFAGIEEQTIITLENIDHLISGTTLSDSGIQKSDHISLNALRIYLKEGQYYDVVKQFVDKKYPGVQAVYLTGDVCRNELLIEIEGLAFIN
jgi:hypothetical protein